MTREERRQLALAKAREAREAMLQAVDALERAAVALCSVRGAGDEYHDLVDRRSDLLAFTEGMTESLAAKSAELDMAPHFRRAS